jgi:hypothetical protein
MSNEQFAQQNSFFTMEAFLMGGLSIIVCMACWAFVDKSTNILTMSQFAFGLAFIVNHPHFLSSYNLLYGDFRKNILIRPRYFWAGIIVPIILAGSLGYTLIAQDAKIMSFIINAMFFSVGWHYTKQIFGCVIVTCARRKMYFSKFERRLLLSNLFSLWALSWFRTQAGNSTYDFYGIKYASFGFSADLVTYSNYAIFITGLMLVYVGFRKYINEGRVINSSALAAFAALYVWYLPTFSHPFFAYLIPLFHSMQYLVFVWSFKQNQVTSKISNLKGSEYRQAWVTKFVGFMVTALGLGYLSFEYVPKLLDSQGYIASAGLGGSPFLATALLFINIHHYFIDNVIWRSDNAEIKAHLFADTTVTQVHKKAA